MTSRWLYIRGLTQAVELDGRSVPSFVRRHQIGHGHEKHRDECPQCRDLLTLQGMPLGPDERVLVYPAA